MLVPLRKKKKSRKAWSVVPGKEKSVKRRREKKREAPIKAFSSGKQIGIKSSMI